MWGGGIVQNCENSQIILIMNNWKLLSWFWPVLGGGWLCWVVDVLEILSSAFIQIFELKDLRLSIWTLTVTWQLSKLNIFHDAYVWLILGFCNGNVCYNKSSKIFCNLQDYLLIINNDTLAASFCSSSFNSSFSWYTSIWFVEFIGTPT